MILKDFSLHFVSKKKKKCSQKIQELYFGLIHFRYSALVAKLSKKDKILKFTNFIIFPINFI